MMGWSVPCDQGRTGWVCNHSRSLYSKANAASRVWRSRVHDGSRRIDGFHQRDAVCCCWWASSWTGGIMGRLPPTNSSRRSSSSATTVVVVEPSGSRQEETEVAVGGQLAMKQQRRLRREDCHYVKHDRLFSSWKVKPSSLQPCFLCLCLSLSPPLQVVCLFVCFFFFCCCCSL